MRYEDVVCSGISRWVESDRRWWVEIISIQHQAVIPHIENSIIPPLLRLWFCCSIIYVFPQHLLILIHKNPIHQLLKAASNSSFRAHGQVGCWMKYHPGDKYRRCGSNPARMLTSSNGNMFPVTGPLCGEFTGHRGIPCTKASEAELWCFVCAWIYDGCNYLSMLGLKLKHVSKWGPMYRQQGWF